MAAWAAVSVHLDGEACLSTFPRGSTEPFVSIDMADVHLIARDPAHLDGLARAVAEGRAWLAAQPEQNPAASTEVA